MPKAKNLKYLRKKSKLTQQKFADIIGVSQQTVNSWETKKTAIPAPSARRIAKHFGVKYSDFCDIDLEYFDSEIAKNPITEDEAEMMLMLRDFPKDAQKKFHNMVKAIHEWECCVGNVRKK